MTGLPERRSKTTVEMADTPAEQQLFLRLVGGFEVWRDGQLQPASAIGSRKARTLLALLAVDRGRLVVIDRIIDALWGDESMPRRPAENVATLVSRLRGGLGQAVVVGGRSGYRLGDSVGVDLRDAGVLVAESEARLAGDEPSLALVTAHRALALLGNGVALADHPDAAWAERARTLHLELLRRARHAAAAGALGAGDLPAAGSAAEEAVAADPLDEAAHRSLMRAYDAAGEPARALAAYERLRATLAQELGIDPATATRDLHVAILRGTVPTAAPRDRSASYESPDTGFAGRERDVSRLASAWSAATEGKTRLVLIAGEAGIGKTRLAEEVLRLARATGGVVAQARCFEAERSLFLQPVVEALRQLVTGLPVRELRAAAADRAGAFSALVPEVATLLGTAPAEHGTAEVERRRSYDAVAVFLRGLSAHRPVLMFLDDLQNAGAATVELLHYLPRHAAPGRLLVLATVRVESGGPALATLSEVADRLDIGPLRTQAIASLATAAGQEALVGQIERRTRGHTLFVVETLRGLASGESGVPESLRATVLARVRHAGAEAEELLRAAAVLGPSFAPATVAGLLDIGVQEAARRCDRILPTRLTTVAADVYEFANDLIQEVVYATTPAPTRVAYHRRAADLLTGNPEAVARHAAAAEDWPRAARGWLAAGERAMRRHAARDAEAMLDRALDAAHRVSNMELAGRVHLARGRAREAMFRYDETLADHEAAVRLARAAGDQRLEMSALRELGGPAWAGVGRPVADGARHLLDGLRLAERLGDRRAESDLLGWLAVLAGNQLRFDDALRYGRRALAAANVAGHEPALAAALDGLKTACAYLGEVADLQAILAELQPLARRLGDLWLVQWCVFESAFPLIATGDWEQATARVEEALAVNRRSGYTGYESWYVAHLGWVARLRGRYDDAVRYGQQSLALPSHAWWSAAAPAMLASTLLEMGEPEPAATLAARGLAVCERHRTEAYRLRCLAPLAEATGTRQLLVEADMMVRAISAPAGSAWLYGADVHVAVARAWLAQDEPRRAWEILAPLLAAAERTGWIAPLAVARGVADQCRALLGDIAQPGQNSSASSSAARAAPPVSTGR